MIASGLKVTALPPDNTYQAPDVKRAHETWGVGIRRLARFG
jgi:hypothetical protein